VGSRVRYETAVCYAANAGERARERRPFPAAQALRRCRAACGVIAGDDATVPDIARLLLFHAHHTASLLRLALADLVRAATLQRPPPTGTYLCWVYGVGAVACTSSRSLFLTSTAFRSGWVCVRKPPTRKIVQVEVGEFWKQTEAIL
jgi:hypothetical protein